MTNWGIDLGGTKIEGIVLTPGKDLKVLARKRVPTEKQKGYHHIMGQIKQLIEEIANEIGHYPEKIGIGTPGAIDPHTQLLKNSNTTSLNNRPFLKDLQKFLNIPVKMANDANCMVLAEATLGVVQEVHPNAEVVFGVILGTGVGGGVVVRNKIIGGHHAIGGEWGHNFLDESGGKCYCGKMGCVETVISGPALERFYEANSGIHKPMKDIVNDYYERQEPFARQTLDRLVHFFGKGIACVINIIDPDVIVIGGGVGNIDLLYQKSKSAIAPYIFNPTVEVPIVKPKLGDSAGVFGAAMLVA